MVNSLEVVVEQIAGFTLFVVTMRQIAPAYVEWDKSQWQNFALEHFFPEADDVTYSLDDAQEIYHP